MRVLLVMSMVAATLSSAVARAELPAIDWEEEATAEAKVRAARTKTIASVVAFTVAVGCAVAAGAFGGNAAAFKADLDRTSPGDLGARRDLISQGESARLYSNIGWGIAGGFGAIGVTVWAF